MEAHQIGGGVKNRQHDALLLRRKGAHLKGFGCLHDLNVQTKDVTTTNMVRNENAPNQGRFSWRGAKGGQEERMFRTNCEITLPSA